MSAIYEFSVKDIDGKEVSMSEFKGQVILIVNTASECGFTPQYDGLNEIYKEYKDEGFVVLGFPCNQFGGQEPGSDADIKSFCSTKFSVEFPMFAKIEVNGSGADPLYTYLKDEAPGLLGMKNIKWNFTKFLIDSKGRVVERFAPTLKPKALVKHIKKLLDA